MKSKDLLVVSEITDFQDIILKTRKILLFDTKQKMTTLILLSVSINRTITFH